MSKFIKLACFLALILAIVLEPLICGFLHGWRPSVPEFSIQYLGVFMSSVSLVTVTITLILQHQEMKIQRKQLELLNFSNQESIKMSRDTYDSTVLNLVNILLSNDMASTRRTAETLREDLKCDQTERIRNELKQVFIKQITDNWGDQGEYELLMRTRIFLQFADFTKLSRYFDMISHYELSETTARAIHFYYVWWRSFFIEVKDIFNDAQQEVLLSSESGINRSFLSFPPNWVTMIDRMDRHMNKYHLALK